MPEIIALLPMKAHSQRVPGKNFRSLYGRPLYRWILDTLLAVEEIRRIVINTDATELLTDPGLAHNPKIKLRERTPELRGDEISMNRIIADDIADTPASIYLMTHATNPLLKKATIVKAINEFMAKSQKGEADSLFTVTRIQNRVYSHTGKPLNHDPANLIQTQDLQPCYVENSCAYIFTPESFRRTSSRIGLSPILFEIEESEATDIDYEEDWQSAELNAFRLQQASRK